FGPVSFRYRYHYGADVITLAPHLMRDLSAVLVAVIAFLLTDRLRAMAIAFGCLLFLIYSFLFLIDWVCATIIFGLVACDDLERLRRRRVLVLGALMLALPAVMMDIAGLSSGAVWLVCIGGAVVIALRQQLS